MVNHPIKSPLYIKSERLRILKNKAFLQTNDNTAAVSAMLTRLITVDLSNIKKLKIILIFRWLLGSQSGSERNQTILLVTVGAQTRG